MATVDEAFSEDIGKCLDIAQRLSKLDIDESRRFVSEQLRILSDFLQKKQLDAEAIVDEEIAEEQRQIKLLQTRIENASAVTDTDDRPDIDLIDHIGLWNSLKVRYWEKVYDAYISDTNESVTTIVDVLIKILKTSYIVCKQNARARRDDIIFQILRPGEVRQTQVQTPGTDQTLIDLTTNCQRACLPFVLQSVKGVIMAEVKLHRDVKRYFVTQLKDLNRALEKYLEKCVEFSWVACFQVPEIYIVTTPKRECPKLAHLFQGLDRTTHASKKSIVEWPALVQGENVLVPWILYDLSMGRPASKKKQMETSVNYRVTRTENADGNVIDDLEDVTKPLKLSAAFSLESESLLSLSSDRSRKIVNDHIRPIEPIRSNVKDSDTSLSTIHMKNVNHLEEYRERKKDFIHVNMDF